MFSASREALILGLCLVLHFAYKYQSRRRLPSPPGPARWPIIGSAFSVPRQQPYVFYKQLGDQLGSKVIYLKSFGQSILVINDLNVAQELLSKRSTIYSSRPAFRMVTEIAGFNKVFALMPYGDAWRTRRQIFTQHFGPRNLPKIQEKVFDFVRKAFIPNLLSSPEKFHNHIADCIGSISISLTYGIPTQIQDDPLRRFAQETFDLSSSTIAPGQYLVNVFSALKYLPGWVPGAGFKRVAKTLHDRLMRLMREPYSESMKRIQANEAPNSFISERLAKHQNRPDSEHQLELTKEVAVQVFGAFFNTTAAATRAFILAMVQNPDIQRKVQKELDTVLGLGHLPDFSDMENLVYFSAVLKESLRWNPVAPLGVPHQTSEDDVYDGYYIPKGTTVFGNAYAMFHNENVYSDPSKFNPERFLDSNGRLRDDLPDPEIVATFGFGRRVCPGSHIALVALRLMAASMLYLFDISPAVDADGNLVQVTPEYAPAIAANPIAFKVKFTPRADRDINGLMKDYMGFTSL